MTEGLHIHHPLDSFGVRKVSLSYIRIEKLEDRLKPGVPFPHKHDFFQIMLIKSGTGIHQIDFIKHKVFAGSLFIMKPGQMHSWHLKGAIKGLIVEFNLHSLNAIKDGTKLIDVFSLSADTHTLQKVEFNKLIELCGIMANEFSNQKDMHDLCLQGLLVNFIAQLIRTQPHLPIQVKAINIIERFKDLLEENFRKEHAVEFYAKTLGTNSKALTMQLSRSLKRPPRALIQERILLEAKRYLAFSNLSVGEIGFELGFDDANYFTRFFKQHEKATPAQFRKKSGI